MATFSSRCGRPSNDLYLPRQNAGGCAGEKRDRYPPINFRFSFVRRSCESRPAVFKPAEAYYILDALLCFVSTYRSDIKLFETLHQRSPRDRIFKTVPTRQSTILWLFNEPEEAV